MMKKMGLALCLSAFLAAESWAGEAQAPEWNGMEEMPFSEEGILGEVLALSDEEITLALGEFLPGEGFVLTGQEFSVTVGEDTLVFRREREEPPLTGREGLSQVRLGDLVSLQVTEEGEVLSLSFLEEGGEEAPPEPEAEEEEMPEYEAVLLFTEDEELKEMDILSHAANENAVLVQEGAAVTLSGVNLEREDELGAEEAEETSYGVGAAALVTDGILSITGGMVNTTCKGSAGVFAAAEGTAHVSEAQVYTSGENSPGLAVAHGGSLDATNVMAVTRGDSSPALGSDLGGGSLTAEGGSFLTKGSQSPAVVCGADFAVNNAVLEAAGAEAIRLENGGKLRLTGCQVSGSLPSQTPGELSYAVLVYQEGPGDADGEGASLSLTGGSLHTGNGGGIYVTNTECGLTLEGVEILPGESSSFLLRCTGNTRGWGQSGNNGASCVLLAKDQILPGDILWDSLSSLDVTLEGESTLTGAILEEDSLSGGEGEGGCHLTLEAGSTWVVTGDSTLTSLRGEGRVVDSEGNLVSIVGADGTEYVRGNAGLVITVENYG